VVAVGLALPAIAAAVWLVVPHEIFERLATIPEQLQSGDLNQRTNIWTVGWQAFVQAPIFGSGAGSFASAAGLGPLDTAHNTVLAILVSGGLIGLFLAVAIVVLVMKSVIQTHGVVRYAFALALLVWMMTSLVATVEESRTTWFLFALIAVAARLAEEEPESLGLCFPEGNRSVALSESPARAL
jgi:O-antigen ligase